MADFRPIVRVTLRFEGRFSNDAHDPGAATMEGITLGRFRQEHPGATVAQLKAISDDEVLRIYREGYFEPIGGDALSQGVGMVAFDYAVNSGVGAGKKALARSHGLTGVARVRKISDGRLSFMHSLKTWRYFGAGWGRRVGSVEAIAIRWESAPGTATAGVEKSAKRARNKSVAHAAVAGTSTGGAASPAVVQQVPEIAKTTSGVGVPQPAVVHIPDWAGFAVAGVFIAVAVVFGVLAFHNSQRASALSAAAKEA